MMTRWDPDKLAAARARGRAKAMAAQRHRDALPTDATDHRGDRKAIALAMYGDAFPLHEIKRVTGLSPSVVSDLAAWAGLPRRARGVRPPGARGATPTIARVLTAMDAPRAKPVTVSVLLGVSLISVVAIHHRRPDPTPDDGTLQHRCGECLARYTGSACPNCGE